MNTLLLVSALVSSASLLAWVWLVVGRGQFWRTDQRLSPRDRGPSSERHRTRPGPDWPAVSVVVPARNEAEVLPSTLPTLLRQDYPGAYHVFVVDDWSEDGTAEVARQASLGVDAPEPPLGALGGLAAAILSSGASSVWLAASGLAAWALMAGSYVPMLRWHGTSWLFAPLLPVTAILYVK